MAGLTMAPPIRTPHLALRELETADYDDARALDVDPGVRWWRGARTIMPDETRDSLAEIVAEPARAPRRR